MIFSLAFLLFSLYPRLLFEAGLGLLYVRSLFSMPFEEILHPLESVDFQGKPLILPDYQ